MWDPTWVFSMGDNDRCLWQSSVRAQSVLTFTSDINGDTKRLVSNTGV